MGLLVPARSVALIVATAASAEFISEAILAGLDHDAQRLAVWLTATPAVFFLAILAEKIKGEPS
jgi:hypothetical protein